MKPIKLEGMNLELTKPDGWKDEDCETLHVFTDHKRCVSCWELTDEELAVITKTKRVYLHVFNGISHPPVAISTEYPFEDDKTDHAVEANEMVQNTEDKDD